MGASMFDRIQLARSNRRGCEGAFLRKVARVATGKVRFLSHDQKMAAKAVQLYRRILESQSRRKAENMTKWRLNFAIWMISIPGSHTNGEGKGMTDKGMTGEE